MTSKEVASATSFFPISEFSQEAQLMKVPEKATSLLQRCATCGKPIITSYMLMKPRYCSHAHYMRAWRLKQKAKKAEQAA
ncbi:hypothetical protein GIV47_14540 [Pseudomonas marginalis]|uniref:hypothetical protein n=1 Tax=Pseudomonas marginalis TaxID=298 RepID=UPI001F166099|nr:hypothetical protein [Pseudomonas marginalis]MCF5666185.1 hypothetical protein [Pseudomonas marginalis]